VARDEAGPLISIEISPIEAVIDMPELPVRIGSRTYWLAQLFATVVINQYARTHGNDEYLQSEEPARFRYFGSDVDDRDAASLEGMLRFAIPALWLAPAWWGSLFMFTANSSGLRLVFGSVLFWTSIGAWYATSQFTSNTNVERVVMST